MINPAPRFLGAVFCGFAILASSACNKKGTPDWDTPGGATPATTVSTPAPLPKEVEPPKPSVPAETKAATEPSQSPAASPTESGLRFISYNVENWLTMDRYVKKKTVKGAPKPDSEKQAVIRILVRQHPDVIGICEIGTAADLAEIQENLKTAGLDLPNSHYTGGSDPTRHLGFLSRFPITSTAKPAETEYQLAGQTYGINRGILDATIEARGKSYRFVGVHLKSKRDSEQGDEEAIRMSEARLLRRHVDSIFKADAEARLIVYGDFNDTRATNPLKLITGKYNDLTYLTAIPAKDAHQEAWTHYWALNDIYSRIDFIMVAKALRKEVNFPEAKIIDDDEWNAASDHRPVMAIFR
ncbi:MAG: endonuclease/exonuclease/phosphatase family protein [Luteolibacter sp.]|uniref:endonuclease/exonuclease/phosphatase family protein n=1 Tax=Luteolibacter sp. TaxID=1962973 RepID=UPI003266D435